MSAGDDDEILRLAARGVLAGAVTAELAAPLERVARTLEQAIDGLDRHVAASRGPEPLPYAAVGELRERVAEAFLEIGAIARLAADLASVAAPSGERAPAEVDLNELVERALSLSRHRLGGDSEVHLDLGTLPVIRLDAVRTVQALAHLFLDAASAAGAAGTVTVHTSAAPDEVRLTVSYPRADGGESLFGRLIEDSIVAEGGRITYSDDGDRKVALVVLAARK